MLPDGNVPSSHTWGRVTQVWRNRNEGSIVKRMAQRIGGPPGGSSSVAVAFAVAPQYARSAPVLGDPSIAKLSSIFRAE
jgi:hypothetical protein